MKEKVASVFKCKVQIKHIVWIVEYGSSLEVTEVARLFFEDCQSLGLRGIPVR